MRAETPTYTETSYRSGVRPTWCPGCGNFAVLSATCRALTELQIPPEQVVAVSGIGCSSRIPYFCSTYGIHGLHGRSVPLATGVKLARPDLQVLVFGGDGDLASIGANHLVHAARRNAGITVVLMDNQVYGLTKAQFSPTSRQGQVTRSSPYGTVEPAMSPVLLALAAGATFVGRSFSGRLRQIHELLVQAIRHRGFSLLHVYSPCREWNDTSAYYHEHGVEIGPGHDFTDLGEAVRLALDTTREYMGLFYRVERPPYEDEIRRVVEKQVPFRLSEYLSRYR